MSGRRPPDAHRTGAFRPGWLASLAGALTLGLVVVGCGQAPVNEAAPAPDSQVPVTAAPTPSPSTATPSPKPTTAPSRTPTAKPSPTKPKVVALLEQGDQGTKVRELQHRLRQVDWYSGTITGKYGKSTAKGVEGFQQKRRYEETGEVDKKTWTKLVSMTRKPTDC